VTDKATAFCLMEDKRCQTSVEKIMQTSQEAKRLNSQVLWIRWYSPSTVVRSFAENIHLYFQELKDHVSPWLTAEVFHTIFLHKLNVVSQKLISKSAEHRES